MLASCSQEPNKNSPESHLDDSTLDKSIDDDKRVKSCHERTTATTWAWFDDFSTSSISKKLLAAARFLKWNEFNVHLMYKIVLVCVVQLLILLFSIFEKYFHTPPRKSFTQPPYKIQRRWFFVFNFWWKKWKSSQQHNRRWTWVSENQQQMQLKNYSENKPPQVSAAAMLMMLQLLLNIYSETIIFAHPRLSSCSINFGWILCNVTQKQQKYYYDDVKFEIKYLALNW